MMAVAAIPRIDLLRDRICRCGRLIEVYGWDECIGCDHVRGDAMLDEPHESDVEYEHD